MALLKGDRSQFPNKIDEIKELKDLPYSKQVDGDRLKELKKKRELNTLTASEITELNNLTVSLADYIETVEDRNFAMDVIINIQKFFKSNVMDFVLAKKQEIVDYINHKQKEFDTNIGKFTDKGEYNTLTSYFERNYVHYNGNIYIALKDNTSIPPTNKEYWKILSIKGETGYGVGLVPKGEYKAGISYIVNDVISYNNFRSAYRCIKDCINIEPTNAEYWQLFMVGDGEDLKNLTTTNKLTLVGAINEVNGKITPSSILASIETVDGNGSGLDADLLDGKHATDFAISKHDHDNVYLKPTGSGSNLVSTLDTVSTLTDLTSGDKISLLFGKIKKFLDSFTEKFTVVEDRCTTIETSITNLSSVQYKPMGTLTVSDLQNANFPYPYETSMYITEGQLGDLPVDVYHFKFQKHVDNNGWCYQEAHGQHNKRSFKRQANDLNWSGWDEILTTQNTSENPITDANLANKDGKHYYCQVGAANMPLGFTDCVVDVMKHGETAYVQMAYSWQQDQVAQRRYLNGNWSEWRIFAKGGDFMPPLNNMKRFETGLPSVGDPTVEKEFTIFEFYGKGKLGSVRITHTDTETSYYTEYYSMKVFKIIVDGVEHIYKSNCRANSLNGIEYLEYIPDCSMADDSIIIQGKNPRMVPMFEFVNHIKIIAILSPTKTRPFIEQDRYRISHNRINGMILHHGGTGGIYP